MGTQLQSYKNNLNICQQQYQSFCSRFISWKQELMQDFVIMQTEEADRKIKGINFNKAVSAIELCKKNFDQKSKSVSIKEFCICRTSTFASLSKIKCWKMGTPFYGLLDLEYFRISLMWRQSKEQRVKLKDIKFQLKLNKKDIYLEYGKEEVTQFATKIQAILMKKQEIKPFRWQKRLLNLTKSRLNKFQGQIV